MERKRAIARTESCFHVLPENLKTLIAQNDKLRSNTSFRWARNIDGTSHAGIDLRRGVSDTLSARHQEKKQHTKARQLRPWVRSVRFHGMKICFAMRDRFRSSDQFLRGYHTRCPYVSPHCWSDQRPPAVASSESSFPL